MDTETNIQDQQPVRNRFSRLRSNIMAVASSLFDVREEQSSQLTSTEVGGNRKERNVQSLLDGIILMDERGKLFLRNAQGKVIDHDGNVLETERITDLELRQAKLQQLVKEEHIEIIPFETNEGPLIRYRESFFETSQEVRGIRTACKEFVKAYDVMRVTNPAEASYKFSRDIYYKKGESLDIVLEDSDIDQSIDILDPLSVVTQTARGIKEAAHDLEKGDVEPFKYTPSNEFVSLFNTLNRKSTGHNERDQALQAKDLTDEIKLAKQQLSSESGDKTIREKAILEGQINLARYILVFTD